MIRAAFLIVALAACKPGGGGAPAQAPSGAGVDPAMRGQWKRTLLTFDQNANDALDDAERTAASGLTYGFTGLTFEPDGKCRLEKIDKGFAGTCKSTTWKGKAAVELSPDPGAGELQSRYAVLIATDKELVLKDGIGNKGTIYVYSR